MKAKFFNGILCKNEVIVRRGKDIPRVLLIETKGNSIVFWFDCPIKARKNKGTTGNLFAKSVIEKVGKKGKKLSRYYSRRYES